MKQLLLRINQKILAIMLLGIIFSLVPFNLNAQQIAVKGIVKDKSNGEVIPFVAIAVKGTNTGTISNEKGEFEITVPSPSSELIISVIGYQNQTVPINGQALLTITLDPSNETLNEIVVTGYQTQKKADLVGAVSVVNVKDMLSVPNSNALQSLQGLVAGLTLSEDGTPSGANTVLTIRGLSSINGNVDPLFIIDGVPTSAGNMYELNPGDIESMQVLKDASSASIYGCRATGGVVIITTKKAIKGENKVTFDARTTYSFYTTKTPMLNAQQFGQAQWQAEANDLMFYGGLPSPTMNHYLSYNYDWTMKNGVPTLQAITLPEYLDTTAIAINSGPNTMKIANTNWFNAISQIGVQQNYNLEVAHGGENGNSLFSIAYTDNKGIIITTEFQRYTARLNSDFHKFNDKLVVGENMTVALTSQVNPSAPIDLAFQALPIVPIHTVDGVGWGGPYGGMNDRDNPVRELEMSTQNTYYNYRLFGNVFADIEPIHNLHIKTSLGMDYENIYNHVMTPAWQAGFLKVPYSMVVDNQGHNVKLTWTNTLNYKLEFKNSVLDAVIGTEYNSENDVNFDGQNQGYLSTSPSYMTLGTGTGPAEVGGGGAEYLLMSYFGKANYVFADKYLASITVREDGSSRFGANDRFGTFPAFNLGWKIGKEDFIKNNFKFISDLKLRYGWGKTGNQSFNSMTANQTLYNSSYAGGNPTWGAPNSTAYNISGGSSGSALPSGYLIAQIGNPNLKWEATTQNNYGIDFGLFEEQIYGSLDFYDKSTTGMLVNPPWLGAIGEGGSEWFNGASMDNKGFEAIVGYRGKIGKFSYDFTGNISTNRNKIISLPEAVVNAYGGNGTTDNILGHPWGSKYGYVADGLFTTQDQVNNSANQVGKGLGRIRYKDLDGDGNITTNDQTWIYNPNPDFTYGFNISCSYAGFDLSMAFQGVGHVDDNVQTVKEYTDFWCVSETGSNKGSRLLNAWTPTNSKSTIPALTGNNTNAEDRFSTYYVENGAYLKMRNFQIGYTIPKSFTEKFQINSLRLYVSGQNLFTIKSSAFTGQDPEFPGESYPLPLALTGGIKLTF